MTLGEGQEKRIEHAADDWHAGCELHRWILLPETAQTHATGDQKKLLVRVESEQGLAGGEVLRANGREPRSRRQKRLFDVGDDLDWECQLFERCVCYRLRQRVTVRVWT